MNYISVKEIAAKRGIFQTQVRKYCTQDRIPKAKCQDSIWLISEKAKKLEKMTALVAGPAELPPLAVKLIRQKKKKSFHGLYDYVQIDLTYSSSRMASNRLTRG